VVIVIVIVDAGFAERLRDRDPASPDLVTRLRRISRRGDRRRISCSACLRVPACSRLSRPQPASPVLAALAAWTAAARAQAYSPIAISPGAPGAALELLYSEQAGRSATPYRLKHMRLTSEANWTWTSAVAVDADLQWATIAVASAP
jgi:hypothetical protein